MASGMPESCKFSSLDSCQTRFLWTHKEDELAPHLVVGLVLQEGDTKKLSQAFVLESLDPFLRASKQGPCCTAIEGNGVDERLVLLEEPKTLLVF